MVEIAGALLVGGLATFAFLKTLKKDNTFTIKSDSNIKIDGESLGGYQPDPPEKPILPVNPPKEEYTTDTINMNGITSILVEGSPTFKMINNEVYISSNADVITRFNKLVISSKDAISNVTIHKTDRIIINSSNCL